MGVMLEGVKDYLLEGIRLLEPDEFMEFYCFVLKLSTRRNL